LGITTRINVGGNVYIELNCNIFTGTNSGCKVIIGANSVLTRSAPYHSFAAGKLRRVTNTLEGYLVQAQANSLGFGNFSVKDKEIALKQHFGVEV
jgi:acetyltransferase-like isoleucine patch superfamily enzyme